MFDVFCWWYMIDRYLTDMMMFEMKNGFGTWDVAGKSGANICPICRWISKKEKTMDFTRKNRANIDMFLLEQPESANI